VEANSTGTPLRGSRCGARALVSREQPHTWFSYQHSSFFLPIPLVRLGTPTLEDLPIRQLSSIEVDWSSPYSFSRA
jgi:hypothetical protein